MEAISDLLFSSISINNSMTDKIQISNSIFKSRFIVFIKDYSITAHEYKACLCNTEKS
jgi:hypothetical protein